MTVNNLLISSLVPTSQNVDGSYSDILYCCVRETSSSLCCALCRAGDLTLQILDTLRLTCKLVGDSDSGKRERANIQICLEKSSTVGTYHETELFCND